MILESVEDIPTLTNPIRSEGNTEFDREVEANAMTFRAMVAGTDTPYTAVLKGASKFQDLIPDEKTRILVAMRMSGVSAEHVVDAIEKHAAQLRARHQVLLANMPKSLIQQRVENLQHSVDTMEKQNSDMETEIELLQQRITDMRITQKRNNDVILKLKVNIEESKAEAQAPIDRALSEVLTGLESHKKLFT